jgi:hypothetical protein
MNDEYEPLDDLDRAIFALPLEVPPPGLRASILQATIAPAPRVAPAFRQWEIAAIGALAALGVWLALGLGTNRGFDEALTSGALAAGRAFADPQVLVWLLAGVVVAAIGSLRLPQSPLRTGL